MSPGRWRAEIARSRFVNSPARDIKGMASKTLEVILLQLWHALPSTQRSLVIGCVWTTSRGADLESPSIHTTHLPDRAKAGLRSTSIFSSSDHHMLIFRSSSEQTSNTRHLRFSAKIQRLKRQCKTRYMVCDSKMRRHRSALLSCIRRWS